MEAAQETKSHPGWFHTQTEEAKRAFDQFRDDFEILRQEIAKVIVGHDDIVAALGRFTHLRESFLAHGLGLLCGSDAPAGDPPAGCVRPTF